jgi:hypothetical protein
MPDPRWESLTAAKPHLLSAFEKDGVQSVEFVAAFPEQHSIGVWLRPATDRQAKRLSRASDLHGRVFTALRLGGFAPEQLGQISITVQSQETLKRDFGGSSFYATR